MTHTHITVAHTDSDLAVADADLSITVADLAVTVADLTVADLTVANVQLSVAVAVVGLTVAHRPVTLVAVSGGAAVSARRVGWAAQSWGRQHGRTRDVPGGCGRVRFPCPADRRPPVGGRDAR